MKILIFLFLSIQLFAQQNDSPKVLVIYPASDSIPVNILRFYIKFSSPMQEMDILKHIKLTDEDGKDITGVFFENQYELWNNLRTEVTLIVDPGRVKLGLLANNVMGRAFDVGKKYALSVDRDLMDFNDQKLECVFVKEFIAVEEDVIPPKPDNWEISIPGANTYDILRIDFNDKIDHISLETLVRIRSKNKEVKGEIILGDKEQSWIFKPSEKWLKGNYEIIIHPRLEDISANSINQIFDHNPSDFKLNKDDHIIIKFKTK